MWSFSGGEWEVETPPEKPKFFFWCFHGYSGNIFDAIHTVSPCESLP